MAGANKSFMTKTHAGKGNHKKIMQSHAAVKANAPGIKMPPANQPC